MGNTGRIKSTTAFRIYRAMGRQGASFGIFRKGLKTCYATCYTEEDAARRAAEMTRLNGKLFEYRAL